MEIQNLGKVVLIFGLLTACQPSGDYTPTLTETVIQTPTIVATEDLSTATNAPSKGITTPEVTRQIDRGYVSHIAYGEPNSYFSGEVKITFVDVLEDSRCPSDVTCVWAGRGTVELEIQIDYEDPINIQLSVGTLGDGYFGEIIVDGVWITLVALEPHPISTQKIQLENYKVALVVLEE